MSVLYSASTGYNKGFDGLTADGEAVRGRTPRKKFDLKLNAEDNLALAA